MELKLWFSFGINAKILFFEIKNRIHSV